MKAMVISSILLILIPLSSAFDFDISSDNNLIANEPFYVKVDSDLTETADVKIYALEGKKTISRIQEGEEWKSSFYYLNAAYPNKKEFALSIETAGTYMLCAKLRYSENKIISSECREIQVSESLSSDYLKNQSSNSQVKNSFKETILSSNSEIKPIILSSNSNTREKYETITSKDKKIQFYMWIFFIILSLSIIFLIILKKI